ncbi:MAG TPA: carboxypeptidase regulatory-like domain-containing protein [Terracidiphilus sp.]|nr:carboxypeptidase regulatory-like domain-containing protein [Terracidiphilus sp.]
MTTTFKPGHHPDADQLSAFIEQALPAHERAGVLAHLAVCSECRAVVALALPEEETVVQAAHVPARSFFSGPWFSNWLVFLPAAAAAVALAAFIFFVHRQAPAPQQQAQIAPAPRAAAPLQPASGSTAQTTAATRPPKAATASPAPPPPAPSAPRETSIFVNGLTAAGRPTAHQAAAPQAGVVQDQSIQSLPAQSPTSSFVSASNNAVVSQNQPAQKAIAPSSAFHGGAIGGLAQSNNNLQQAEANAQNGQQQNGLQQNSQQQTANQTVQVQAETPAPVTANGAQVDAVLAGRATASLNLTRQPLPSRLPLLSSATRGPIVLAIDTHHTVFVSNDSGQHWERVRAVWKGRAVRVEAIASVMTFALREPGASMGTLAALPQGAAVARMGEIALTGTVTDQSGAVIPGAAITIADPQRGLKRSITTDANGRYVVAGLEPGNYDVQATARGFMSGRLSNVAVTASKANVVNFTLRVGAASESVTVENSTPSIEVESAPEPEAIPETKAAPRAKAAPIDKAKPAPAPLFEMVTDKGVHWTSADGLTWQVE